MSVVTPTILGTASAGRASGPTGGSYTATFSHTVPAGTNALVVAGAYDYFAGDPPTVTWNGLVVPRWHNLFAGERPCLYILIDPPPGTGNVVIPGSPVHGGSVCGAALNVANFAGIRWIEYPFAGFFAPTHQSTHIYTQATDLLFDAFIWDGFGPISGATATPDPGQTLLVSQSGLSDGALLIACSQGVPVDMGAPPTQGNYSTMGWSTSVSAFWSHYVIAFKGLDTAAPVGMPSSVGRMTHTDTVDQQAPPPDILPANTPWRWRHEVPSTHRFLVVTAVTWDEDPVAVTFQPDGGAAVPLTLVEYGSHAGVFILPDAPVGLGWLRIVLTNDRWFGASAYSLSTSGLIAAVSRIGTFPPLDVPSEPGAIVIDHIGNLDTNWRSFVAVAPQAGLFYQPIVGNANTQEGVTSPFSMAGAGSWRTADSALTDMGWTITASSNLSRQAGFSFIGITPPPPSGRTGCPDALPLLPADGEGCSTTIAPEAV